MKYMKVCHARVIQHEYDHIEGILFVERLKPLKKKLIQRKLNDIKVGKVSADYKIKFARTLKIISCQNLSYIVI